MSDIITKTFPADGPIRLSIEQRSGDVEVTAADTAEVTVRLHPSGPGGDELADRTTVEYRPGALRVEVPRSTSLIGRSPSVDIVVTVPAGSAASVQSGSGDIRLLGPLADVSGKAGSGAVSVQSAADVRLTTGSGDVTVDDCAGAAVRTGSGDIRIRRLSGSVDLESGSGAIDVDGTVGDGRMSAASGDVTIGSVAGRVGVTTASGDITVREAVEGDITAGTASGGVTVGLAAGTAAKLDVSSITGSVRSDLDPADAPAETDRTLLLAVTTVSGSIRLHRAG
ncbi:DUF4097 family beta strand repeat-containing protein [Jiangella asiatica]|uniref:DUF4097 domain-containing protein n=1 Tax=Jiangella asiatica TaxID=2530372 RepID=A0A4R5D6L0_9ACTN|nr:DUF4097 family beta strand repeat-containing protein [Jiangella asiatica]TDE08227.1 hypothetical protein E1269_18135 [Jiangella asiatica]